MSASIVLTQEAVKLLSTGYRGIQKDVAAELGWPAGRIGTIKTGRVPKGATRYGPVNQQLQAVIVTAQRLIARRAAR